MSKRVRICLAAAGILSFAVPLVAVSQTTTAMVFPASGTTTLVTGGNRQTVGSGGTTLRTGDQVITGANSSAIINLPNAGKVLLGQSTSVTNVANGSNLQLALSSGSVCAQAQAPGLSIASGPLLLAARESNTTFDVSQAANSSTAAVYGGNVNEELLSGATRTVGAEMLPTGAAIQAASNGPPHQADIAAVSQGFRPLGCPDEVTMSRVLAQASTASPDYALPSNAARGILGFIVAVAAIALAATNHKGAPASGTTGSFGGPTSGPSTGPTGRGTLPSSGPGTPTPVASGTTPTPLPSTTSAPTPTPVPTATPAAKHSP